MKNIFTILFIIFFSPVITAQIKIDSLKRLLPAAKDTARINILNELSSHYLSIAPVFETSVKLSVI